MSLSFKRILYAIIVITICLATIISLLKGDKIHSDLNSLLPQTYQNDPIWQAVQSEQNHRLNAQIILLIGAENTENAIANAKSIAEIWQASQLFSKIDAQIAPNIANLSAQIKARTFTALPVEQAQLLLEDSKTYFQHYAQSLINPFQANMLPLNQDWLGFGRFALDVLKENAFQWDSQSGFMMRQTEGKTWILLRIHMPEQIHHQALQQLLVRSRIHAKENAAFLLASGGALFSADSKIRAEKESLLMSVFGFALTFLLMASLWKSWKLTALLFPLFTGLMAGVGACLVVFGHIHALTLVIGSSLLGVLIDFPLHWLAGSLFANQWQPNQQMHHIYKTFALSLSITAVGYALLFFTPLQILKETAIFSSAALIISFFTTALLLPPLYPNIKKRSHYFNHFILNMMRGFAYYLALPKAFHRLSIAALFIFSFYGLYHSRWQDDIRDWNSLNPQLLSDTQSISQITQFPQTGQYLLTTAPDTDSLLSIHQLIEQNFNQNTQQIETLYPWLMSIKAQNAIKKHLSEIIEQPEIYADLLALGISQTQIIQALSEAAHHPTLSLAQQLSSDFAEGAKSYYLGNIAGQEVSLLPIKTAIAENTFNSALSQIQSQIDCANCLRLIDTRENINSLFAQTRNQAAWLKIFSILLAGFLLWKIFGWRQGAIMLIIPLSSAAISLAILSFLHIPIGLFPMFGLLLAAAIGLDYTVYAFSIRDSLAKKCGALCLAAITSEISFLLLCFSATQVIKHFGLVVALGIGLNVLFTLLLLIQRNSDESKYR